MCERRSTVDDLSNRRVREREPPPHILHNGFCQFEHDIHRVRAGGPRVPDVYAILDLAVPDEAGTLHQLGVRDSLIRFAQNWGYPNAVEAPNIRSFVDALACWWTLSVLRFRVCPSICVTIFTTLYDCHDVRPLTLFRFIS